MLGANLHPRPRADHLRAPEELLSQGVWLRNIGLAQAKRWNFRISKIIPWDPEYTRFGCRAQGTSGPKRIDFHTLFIIEG